MQSNISTSVDAGLRRVFTQVYGLTAGSIFLALLTAYFAAKAGVLLHGWSAIVLMIVMVAIPIVMSFVALKHPVLGLVGLIAFAVTSGLLMSYVFVVYSAPIITAALLSASAIFVVMSVIGLTTKRDVGHWSVQLSAMLLAVIVVSIINIFLHSPMVELIISVVTVIIFTVMTMVDTAQIKAAYIENDHQASFGVVVLGTLSLYLDFINLFLRLLEIFAALSGNNDDN